jgi:hypothetical protein
VIAQFRHPNIASSVDCSGREFQQLAGSCSCKPLEVDQIATMADTDFRIVSICSSDPRQTGGVVVGLSPACQEWSDTFEPIQNCRINQLVRDGMLEDSANTTHPRVDCGTTPARFHHLRADGL